MRTVCLIALLLLVECSPDLKRCDEAIHNKLKAPSTYKRVAQNGMEGLSYEIDFDAENSFGTPLRDKAHCYLTGGKVDVFLDSEMGVNVR